MTDDDFHVERVSADQLHGLRRRILRNDDQMCIRDRLLGDPDAMKAGRVRDAMMVMSKIEVDKLQAAYDE